MRGNLSAIVFFLIIIVVGASGVRKGREYKNQNSLFAFANDRDTDVRKNKQKMSAVRGQR